MTRLLDRMPFDAAAGEVTVRGERTLIRADQIIVWISLTRARVEEPNPAAIPFPAILDTGHTHSFAISERHLIDWGGLRPEDLGIRNTVRDRGQKIFLREANIWAYPNSPGQRGRLTNQSPLRVKAGKGIAVYPGADFPRLPLLGLRAVAENNLVLKVDGPKRAATLRTSLKWWPFG